jgi:hypothetical protein
MYAADRRMTDVMLRLGGITDADVAEAAAKHGSALVAQGLGLEPRPKPFTGGDGQ